MDRPEPPPADESSIRRLAGNALWMLVAEVAAKVASFVLVIILARGLGPTQYGYFNFALSFVALFLMLGAWGIDISFVRQVSERRERHAELFASGLALRAALGLAGMLAAFAIAPLFVSGREAYLTVVIMGSALFLDELSSYLGAVFKAFERMRFHALVILINRFLSTGLAAVAIAVGGGLVMVSATYLLGSLGALTFGWFALRRYFPSASVRKVERPRVAALLRYGTPLALGGFLNIAVLRIDAVMLQAMKGPAAVGMYGVAYRFFESLLFVTWALSVASLPRIIRGGAGERSSRTFELTASAIVAVYLPIAVGALFTAEWVVVTLFSEQYRPASSAVAWLTGAVVFYGVAHLSRMASIGLGRRREIAWIAVAVLAVNLVGNLIAIPRYGFVGAAAVMFVTELVEAVLLVGLFLRTSGPFTLSRVAAVPVVATAVMGGTLALTGIRDLPALITGSVVYLLALIVSARLIAPEATRRALALVHVRRGGQR